MISTTWVRLGGLVSAGGFLSFRRRCDNEHRQLGHLSGARTHNGL